MTRRRPHRGIPPRGPALEHRTMLVTFDIDCGEQLAGHRFIARGLSDDGDGFGPDDDCPRTQTFSLEYELVPGIAAEHQDDFFRFLVGIEYSADAPLPWEPVDGGAIAPFEGGASTHGSRGSWPLPAGARELHFDLRPVLPGERWPAAELSGRLTVDPVSGSVRWSPH